MEQIAGNAFNSGINFVSDSHRIRVEKSGEEYVYRLSKTPAAKNTRVSKLFNLLERIPLIRGPVSMIRSSRLYLLIIGTTFLFEIVSFVLPESVVSQGSSAATFMQTVLLLILAGLTIYILVKIIYRGNETRRFHGAEHKTVNTLDAGKELTLENVRAASRVSRRCGTQLVVFLCIFYFLLEKLIPFSSIAMLMAISFSYEIFRIKDGDKLPVLKYLFKAGYFLQKNCFTAEPNEKQLLAAIHGVEMLRNARL